MSHTWLYDTRRNSLKDLSIRNSSLVIPSRIACVLQVTAPTGRTVGYSYDNQHRLTQEAVTGDPSVVNGTGDWAYDLVGNCLSRTSTLDQILDRAETYSANNWLDSPT